MPDLIWTANEGSQEELVFGDLGQVREILYGGQKGGGKSGAIPALSLMHIAENPTHARVLILRETFGELDDLMDMMRSYCSAAGATWNEQKKTWSFPCGARLRFGHLGDGCRPYWGREFSLIIIDELTRCIATERDYTMLLGSLRNSKGVPCQVVSMTNPGGPGHNWVKARFMASPPLTVVTDDRTGLERVFIPAALRENEHNLGPEYRQTLEMLPDAEREAYLNGDWDAFEGAVFKLTPGVHTWSWAQFKERTGQEGIPSTWLRYRAYDHGLAAPGAAYWIAVDHAGRAYAYRELYTVARDAKGETIPNKGAAYPPRDVAKMIATRSEGESYAGSWSGRDLFDEVRRDHGGGQTLASHFALEGIHFQAWTVGPGSRIAGKQALHQWLAIPQDGDGFPGLVFITEECPHAIRTLPALEYSRTQPEQVDDSGEDHCFDALAGWAKMKAWAPLKPKNDDPLANIRRRAGGGSWMSA